MKRRKKRDDLFKTGIGMSVQLLALLCLIIVVYIIGRSFIKPDTTAKGADMLNELTAPKEESGDKTAKKEETTKKTQKETAAKNTKDNTKNTIKNTRNTRNTRRTSATTEETAQAEISTKYGPETNQDGNSPKWISEQKDVIDLEKDRYELRGKGKSGIQYIDPNGDVAKVLYQPEDSLDGKSYEEYYYQGNELIYASIWKENAEGTGEKYYYNNGVLIQWVDGNGLIYNKETKGKKFADSSKWEKYLNAGMRAMRKTDTVETATTLVENTTSASTAQNSASTTKAGASASTTQTFSSDSTVQ